jgi:hypothetical protein
MSRHDGLPLAANSPAASFAVSLIRRAAHHAPHTLAERLEEEWLADLAAQDSPFARLRFALGCCWATWVIAHEHRAASAPVAATPGDCRIVLPERQALLPRHASAFLLVLCAHLGAIYLLSICLALQQRPPHQPVVATLQVDETPIPALAPDTMN